MFDIVQHGVRQKEQEVLVRENKKHSECWINEVYYRGVAIEYPLGKSVLFMCTGDLLVFLVGTKR